MIGNNNKLTAKDVGKVWVRNLSILGWFSTSATFCVGSQEILTGVFLSCTVGKRYEMDQKEGVYVSGAKQSEHGLVFNLVSFGGFFV